MVVRRLLFVACLVVFIDVSFYEAITPLLAEYRNSLGLTKGEAGLLVGAYAGGSLINSFSAGFAAAKLGPRRIILAGLTIFGLAGIAFGFADNFAVLFSARLIQGASAAMLWSGAMTWLINSFPAERRGAVIGTALAASMAGALFGPAIGAVASEIGTEIVFTAAGGIAFLIAVAVMSIPDATARDDDIRGAISGMFKGPVAGAATLIAVPSIMFGVIAVLIPLQIDSLGGSSVMVALGFALGAVLEGSLSPVVGRFSDIHGRMLPYGIGTAVAAIALLIVPAQNIPLVLGALIGSALGAAWCFGPASAQLADNAESVGLHQGPATAIANIAWAIGQAVGSVGSGALAEAYGELLPCALTALILAAASVPAWRRVLASRAPAG